MTLNMTKKQARELWTKVTAPSGEQCLLTTHFGAVAVSHGLKLEVYTEISDFVRDRIPERAEELRDIATFLREWADLIAVKEAPDESS